MPHVVDPDAHGIVLTLDDWVLIPQGIEDNIVEFAKKLADNEGEIIEQDRRKIAFSSVADFERLLTISDESIFLSTLAAAREGKFAGRSLASIRTEIDKAEFQPKQFPFDLGDVLPWWKAVGQLEANQYKAPQLS